ncbi:beta-galactosidase [termite gut metagenome]|uniref:Beta-galactosidase n=1 Tax=termite gut metagenome TaxID=433724 RepID=A0A5J4SBA8_9ZZZZ
MKKKILLLVFAFFLVANLFAQSKIYLFSYFLENGKDGLHLAYSYDGLKWEALHKGNFLLAPEVGKDKLMRDPSICQAPDGTFHLVWTSSWTDRIIGYASSKDLIHWSEQQAIPVMIHEPEAQNC